MCKIAPDVFGAVAGQFGFRFHKRTVENCAATSVVRFLKSFQMTAIAVVLLSTSTS